MQKGIVRDCISMCFDICTINIRVSIRVRGLHLVFGLVNLGELSSIPMRSWLSPIDDACLVFGYSFRFNIRFASNTR